MSFPVHEIPGQFACDCTGSRILPLTIGHINKTYKVVLKNEPVYLLQQINSHVFRDVDGLMENTRLVLNTMEAFNSSAHEKLEVQKLITTKTGKLYHTDNKGRCWRMFTYIKGAKTIETVRKYNTAYEGGRAYGLFLSALAPLNPALLNTVIPDFHSLESRYRAFRNALVLNLSGRAGEVKEEIDFIDKRIEKMMVIPEMLKSGKIPLRVVHNDTKFNNLIFSETGNAIAVTDLDTVMPGSALFDFGDAIRSAANTAREDEPNLLRIGFDISVFEAFASGYISHSDHLLTEEETASFPDAAMLMTFIIGTRFLTDFINGDVYYQTRYPMHNLVRAKVQFQLIRKMEEQLSAMQTAIRRIKSRLHLINS